MAAYERRLGSTNLFSNRDKKNDNQPDYKGSIEVQVGDQIVELDLAMWHRHGDKAGDYFGMTAKAKSTRPLEDVEHAMPSGKDEDIRF